MAQDVSAEHFEWLVEGRSRNQRSTFDLYKFILDHEIELNGNVELQAATQEAAGIAFSLWRAVFLSDTTGDFDAQWADVKKFLISLISDNTVLYITGKNSRNWSFTYYLDNATLRLDRLAATNPEMLDLADLAEDAVSDKDEWLNAQSSLERVVAALRFAAAAIRASS